MTMVEVYADDGISVTSTAKRDEFNRTIADCKAGKIDMIGDSIISLREERQNILTEPESGRYSAADDYLKLLHDFIEYVRTKYPKYAHYTELIEILGEEIEMKEAATRMKRSDKTLYGWLKRLRPIFDEFKDTVNYL